MSSTGDYKDIPLYLMGLFNLIIKKDSDKGNELLNQFIEDKKKIIDIYNKTKNLESFTINIENLNTSYINRLSKSNLNI